MILTPEYLVIKIPRRDMLRKIIITEYFGLDDGSRYSLDSVITYLYAAYYKRGRIWYEFKEEVKKVENAYTMLC